MQIQPIMIHTPHIQLDQFLKWSGIAMSGGEAKIIIQEGLITINGVPETRIQRKLYPGDRIEIKGDGGFELFYNEEG